MRHHQGPQHHHQPASPIVKSLKLFIMPEETTHVPKSEAGRNDLEQTGQYFSAFPYLLADDATNTITKTDFEQILRESAIGPEFSEKLFTYAFYHQIGYKESKPMEILSDSSENVPTPARWACLLADSNTKHKGYDLIMKPITPSEAAYLKDFEVKKRLLARRNMREAKDADEESLTLLVARRAAREASEGKKEADEEGLVANIPTDSFIHTRRSITPPTTTSSIMSSSSVVDVRHNDDQTPLTIDLSFDNNEMVDVSTTDQKKSLDLADLQIFEYSSDHNDVRCSICLELLDKSDLVYALLSCMQIFHVQCLRRAWKRESNADRNISY